MKGEATKYFEYDGEKIFFVFADDKYWIAVKPVCSILGIHYDRQCTIIKKDPVINGIVKLQYFVAADQKKREMTCLPELVFYYWLLQVRSSKKEIRPTQFELFETIYRELNFKIKLEKKILIK